MEQAVVVAPLGATVVAHDCGNQGFWESEFCAVLLLLLLLLSSSWGKLLCDSCCGSSLLTLSRTLPSSDMGVYQQVFDR